MYPLLVFASGLVAGAVGLRLLKNAKVPEGLKAATASGVGTIGTTAQSGVGKAQTVVREVTISGLSAIEKTSAHLRSKLTPTPEEPADAPPPTSDEPTPDEPPPAAEAVKTAPVAPSARTGEGDA